MGTGRSFNKAPKTRPKKKPGEKRRRERIQNQRLVALGVDVEVVRHMDPKAIREMLKRPLRVKAQYMPNDEIPKHEGMTKSEV